MKRILKVLSLCLCLSLFQAVCPAQSAFQIEKAAESMLVDAVQAFEEGKYETAYPLLTAIVKNAPSNDAAHFYLGLSAHYLDKADEAERELREAVRLDPHNYWYRDRLAVLFSLTGREELTIDIYESLIEDFPKKTEIYYNLVNLYARQNRMDKVLETLDAIETIMGKDETTTLARYDVLMRQDKAEDAYKALEAFNDEFSSPQILSMMGDARLTDYADTLAMSLYDEALSIDAEYAPAILGKSEVYRMRRSYDDYFKTLEGFASSKSIAPAMKSQYLNSIVQHMDARFVQNYRSRLDSLFETGVKAHPSDSSMLLSAGTYYFRTDRRSRANELFRVNSELYPDDFNSVAMYVQALTYSEDWNGVAEAAAKAAKQFPEEPAFLNTVLGAHYNIGDYPAVIRDAQNMMDAFPDRPDVVLQSYSVIGDTYYLMGDEKSAFKYYDKALKIDPAYVSVLNNYAYYLSLKGKQLKKAYQMSRITVEKEPDNATYLDTFAWILHLQGKDLEAKSFFKHAMLYGGKESATILEHYADVLEALGENDLSKVYRDMSAKKEAED